MYEQATKGRSALTLTVYWAILYFIWLGGGGASEPPSDLGPEVANRRQIWHAPQKLCKEKDFGVTFLKNCIFY